MIKQFSDLTEQQVREICEAFAKREGWKFYPKFCDEIRDVWTNTNGVINKLPAYATDKNAMGRIIEGMDRTERYRYCHYLLDVTGYTPHSIILATAQQQFVAAAMALGILKEGEK